MQHGENQEARSLGREHSSPKANAARKAVMTLLAHSNSTFTKSNSSLEIAPSSRADRAARSPTTVACTCQGRNQKHEEKGLLLPSLLAAFHSTSSLTSRSPQPPSLNLKYANSPSNLGKINTLIQSKFLKNYCFLVLQLVQCHLPSQNLHLLFSPWTRTTSLSHSWLLSLVWAKVLCNLQLLRQSTFLVVWNHSTIHSYTLEASGHTLPLSLTFLPCHLPFMLVPLFLYIFPHPSYNSHLSSLGTHLCCSCRPVP